MISFHDLRLPENDRRVVEWLTHLSDNLRQCDLDEIRAMVGMGPVEALATSVVSSTHGWVIARADGVPVGIYGAAPGPLPGVGVVWMVGTDEVKTYGLAIAKQTKPAIAEMMKDYPVLWNHVDARNEVSMQWLRWAGFHVIGEEPLFGPEQRLFYLFARTTA